MNNEKDRWSIGFIPMNNENGKTRLSDEIEFALPGGSLTESLAGWLAIAQLQQMFSYRHQVTQRECLRLK